MKNVIKKATAIGTIVSSSFVQAYAEPGFNESAAKELFSKIVTPLTSFLLWAVPSCAGAGCLVAWFTWMGKEEDEKEQKPVFKTIKKIIVAAVVVESITAILKIFGL